MTMRPMLFLSPAACEPGWMRFVFVRGEERIEFPLPVGEWEFARYRDDFIAIEPLHGVFHIRTPHSHQAPVVTIERIMK